jgi:hypothetical protein
MSGGGFGAVSVIVASARWSDAVGPDTIPADAHGASFAVSPVGGVGGCGDATGASGTASAGVAGTACGVAGNDVSSLVSASAVLMRCHRLGSVPAGTVMPASGDMT